VATNERDNRFRFLLLAALAGAWGLTFWLYPKLEANWQSPKAVIDYVGLAWIGAVFGLTYVVIRTFARKHAAGLRSSRLGQCATLAGLVSVLVAVKLVYHLLVALLDQGG
jgi:hypothetical protein